MSGQPGSRAPLDSQLDELRSRLGRLGRRQLPLTEAAGEYGAWPERRPAEGTEPEPSRLFDSAGGREAADGREQSTPHGPCLAIEVECVSRDTPMVAGWSAAVRPLPGRQPGPACDWSEACVESLSTLAGSPAWRAVDWQAVAFIDVETTGLAGGTGTYAFLVGIGRLDGPRLRVWQFLMRDPSEEAAVLHCVSETLRGTAGLVTFNGRRFDLPLLRTRYVLHRMASPVPEHVPHLDLLPPARRLWGRRLPSCALTALELDVLGLQRVNDVPGWMIPGLYMDFQRTRRVGQLWPVFTHNVRDIVSMADIAHRLSAAFRWPERHLGHAHDWYSLALVYESAGAASRAVQAYERVAEVLGRSMKHADLALRVAALRRLGLLHKRAGRWEAAALLWHDLAYSPTGDLHSGVELAKYLEHQRRDLAAARDVVRRCIQHVGAGRLAGGRNSHSVLAELHHRLRRIERKLSGRLHAQC